MILEMDGLSSNSDRKFFSEALTLYLYRYRLAQGPRAKLTNLIVLEEAHNLLLRHAAEGRESVLEGSIRQIRQYGLGYLFVDQSASSLSKVAFSNSYATIALSQKLRSDIQAMAGAMNLGDEQKQALSTLPVGSAIVRLADEHPEPFLVRIPRSPIEEGSISDGRIREHMAGYSARSAPNNSSKPGLPAIPPVPLPDKKEKTAILKDTHPPSPGNLTVSADSGTQADSAPVPAKAVLYRDETRFLADIAAPPLSTTVPRYQRLHLSRRRGNAIRRSLLSAGVIESVPIATRSGQVVLFELTDPGRSLCRSAGLEVGPVPRSSLEHRFWVSRARTYYEGRGYDVTLEYTIKGNAAVDLLAERPGEKLAIEIETGKSDIPANLHKTLCEEFDRIVLVATNSSAVRKCQRAIETVEKGSRAELMTWLDL